MFANRLQKRFRHLKKWANRNNIGAFRLFDRDIPEIPVVIDFYGDVSHPQDAALSGALYKRPYEKDEAQEEIWLSVMKEIAAAALGIKPENIFIKQRQIQRGLSQYEKMSHENFTKIVNENGFAFKVNLTDYLDTGLFSDRRLLRSIIRDEAPGKKILNLFSYTGSFSVYAASGGAASTDSVDLSNTYLKWAKENFELNGLKAEIIKKNYNAEPHKEGSKEDRRDCKNKLIRADALEYINKSYKEKRRWDLIVIDPPAFSNSKKMADNFDLYRDLIKLIYQCLKLLSPDGKIFLSINLRRYVPAAQELETELISQFSINVRITDLSGRVVDEDFKGRKTPGAFLINLL